MWIDRVSFSISKGSIRKAGFNLTMGLCLTCLAFSLTSCAQQSDLVKVEKDLEGKITKLDREKKALAQVLKQAKQEAKQEIADARSALEQQKAELNDEITKARAQIKSELRSLREENLPKVVGDLETQFHQIRINLEKDLQQQDQRMDALKELREQREAELSNRIVALGKRLDQALAQHGKKVSARFAEFQGSLGQFKKILAGVNNRLDEEGKRATSAESKIRQDLDQRIQAFGVKLDSDTQTLKTYLETEVKTAIQSINAKLDTELAGLRQTDTLHGKNIEDVTLSLTQLRDVLGTTGTQLGTKLDSQGKGLEQTAKRVEQLQGQYAALAKKLDADVKGLHGYLEKEVRPSLKSIVKVFGEEKSQISQELIKFKSGLQRVEQASVSSVTQTQTQLDAQAKHVQELGEAVAGMREVLDSVAGMLGNRTDQHMNQLGQLTAQLTQLKKERSAEAAKQASNTEAVSTHLNEVAASVQSIGESFEQFKGLVFTKLEEQANRLQIQDQQTSKVQGVSSAVTALEQSLKANVTQLNKLTQSVAQLKEVVQTMGDKLGSKVATHESQLNKQASRLQTQDQRVSKVQGVSSAVTALEQNLKANVTQLNELTQSVVQLKEVVRAMGDKLGSKVAVHESQLNKQASRLQTQGQQVSKVQGVSSAVTALERSLKANVTQLNELTQSVEQLKEVVSTMDDKLGSKVAAHESQLIEVEQALKKFGKPVRSKKPRSP